MVLNLRDSLFISSSNKSILSFILFKDSNLANFFEFWSSFNCIFSFWSLILFSKDKIIFWISVIFLFKSLIFSLSLMIAFLLLFESFDKLSIIFLLFSSISFFINDLIFSSLCLIFESILLFIKSLFSFTLFFVSFNSDCNSNNWFFKALISSVKFLFNSLMLDSTSSLYFCCWVFITFILLFKFLLSSFILKISVSYDLYRSSYNSNFLKTLFSKFITKAFVKSIFPEFPLLDLIKSNILKSCTFNFKSANSFLWSENLSNISFIEFWASKIFLEFVLINSWFFLMFWKNSECSFDFLINSIILFSYSLDLLTKFLIKSGLIFLGESIS